MALAVPVMFQRAGLVLMIAVGLIMTGHAGENEQAYYAAAFPIHMSILVTGIGLLLSVTVLSAQAHGAGRALDCGRIWRLGLISAAILGGFCAVIMLHGQTLLRLFGLDEDLAMHGGRVLWMYAYGVPAMLMYVATTSFLESIGRALPGFGISLGANVINALLCWIFVFGKFGFDPMGAEGAAMALTMTRGFMLLAAALYAMRMADHAYFGVNATLTGFLHNIKKMLRIGTPLALANGLESVAFALVTFFAGWLGAKELATFQDALNLNAMIFMLAIGVATATAVRVANAVGRGDQSGLRRAGWVGAGIEIVITGLLAILIVAGCDIIAGIYTSEIEVQLILVAVLPLVAWVSIADGLQAVILAATRGVADTVVPTVLQGISFWVVMVPLCYYLSHIAKMGVQGLFIGIGVAVFVASTMLAIRFFIHTRRVILPI
jgi:multidrug resistance protein, MATE family